MLLKQQMMVLQAVADPFERLKAMGKIYMAFAREYPDFYDLMFILRAPMNALEDPECWQEGQSSFDILIHVVEECIQQGKFKGHNSEDLAYVIWSTLHGMVTISIRDRCKVISEDKREDIESLGLETFTRLLTMC